MTDEEREALEILNNTEWDGFMITIKNLIEKLSKEIEEYKECERLSQRQLKKQKNDIETLKIEIEELKVRNFDLETMLTSLNSISIDKKYVKNNYISKDKIKAKIEELEKRQEDLRQLSDSVAKSLGIEDCQEKIILYRELLEEE